MRTTTRWRLVATGAGLILAASLSGCGSETGALSASEQTQKQIDKVAAEFSSTQAEAQALVDRIRGTEAQRAAAEFLTTFALNEPTRECMAEKGYVWNPPELSAQSPAVIEPFGDSVWLREPLRPIASQTLLLSASFRRAEAEGRTQKQPDEERDALVACISQNEQKVPSDDDLDDRDYSPSIARLDAKFGALVDGVDSGLASAGEYTKCMSELGTEAGEALGEHVPGYASVRLNLQNAAPAASDISVGDEAPSPAWTEFQTSESKTLLDDATCRLPHYADGMNAIAPMLAQFESEHSDELAALDAHWAGVMAEATRAGFEPALDMVTLSRTLR